MEILVKAGKDEKLQKQPKNDDSLKMITIIIIKNNVYMSAQWKKCSIIIFRWSH